MRPDRLKKQAVSGFVLASNLQGSMLTPRGGGMVRPADVQRISKLSGVGSCMVRQNATADLVGASVVKVPAAMITMRRKNSNSAIRPTS